MIKILLNEKNNKILLHREINEICIKNHMQKL